MSQALPNWLKRQVLNRSFTYAAAHRVSVINENELQQSRGTASKVCDQITGDSRQIGTHACLQAGLRRH
jgi:hypothetical protein